MHRKTFRELAFVFILLMYFSPLKAQEDSNSNKLNIWENILGDTKDFLSLGGDLVTSPAKFNTKDFTKLGITVAGTGLLFLADNQINDFAIRNQSASADKFLKIDKYYGSGYTIAFTAGIYGYGLLFNNKDIRRLGFRAGSAFIYAGLTTGILKVILGRARPYFQKGNNFYKPFQLTNNDYQSLPSGHTTVAFAVSTVMADYSDNLIWKVFWYSAAGLVGAARIYNNQHWASDVFLAASIGYFVGKFVANNENGRVKISSLSISPFITFNNIGIHAEF